MERAHPTLDMPTPSVRYQCLTFVEDSDSAKNKDGHHILNSCCFWGRERAGSLRIACLGSCRWLLAHYMEGTIETLPFHAGAIRTCKWNTGAYACNIYPVGRQTRTVDRDHAA